MLVVLPNKHDGLNTLLPKLQSGGLKSVLSGPFGSIKAELHLPRFKLSENEGIEAKTLLMKLGMNLVFSSTAANLKRMCASVPLFVSAVKHKAVLEVDEEGATAAAATGVKIQRRCLEILPQFRVDHPFVVALVYDDEIPVFLGHVTDPEAN
ncbi:unnamed protein product [Echinostoma caproni]|uniref:SERPIN domain-containing protein n=1 Tax=Echinostoma caproni TaxID=27848 RepID=A0A183AQZ4_9TREM|nr:unnamed protein product [Echinostoma caproni]